MQCFHCGREAGGTTHTQKRYHVDYFRLHTGSAECVFLINPKEDTLALRYLRLTRPIDSYLYSMLCAPPDVRQRLDDDVSGRRSIVNFNEEKDNEVPTPP